MVRRYLDEIVPVNSGIIGQYVSPVGPFREPMYAKVDNDTVAVTPTPTRTRSNKSKKKKANKPKNDGIIRNHDSVWDYKIQDGKLLTRRKTSDGKWYDITSNDEARQRIEQFTGRSIGSKQNTPNNNSQNSKPANASKPSNSSQSQPSKPASTAQTQQTAKPAATQPTRQQAARQDSTRQQTTPQRPVARQDSTRRDTTVASQPRSLARTPAFNAEPDWQTMTDAEVQAYFSNSPLGGVTKIGKGNPNKKTQLLSDADLRANGWHWSNGQDFADKDTENYNLLESARRKASNDNILLDSNGAVVPTSAVQRYINRGRVPLYLSDYDAQFYQPQSENGTLRDVRRAQDRRRNYEFDRQRNIALGTMLGVPALAGSVATAPIATAAALGTGELLNAGARALGFDYDKWVSGRNDANAEFYGPMTNPFRIAGNIVGGIAGNAIQPKVSEAVNPYVNRAIGYLTNKFSNIGVNRNIAYPSLAATEETEASMALARAMEDALNPRGTTKQLARAMNKSLKNKNLIRRERQMLAEDAPQLFDGDMANGYYYYPLNPAMPAQPMGPYAIPNHVNGIPFGVPVPRILGGVPETTNTWALPVRPNSSLQPMPDAFGYYGAPYRRPVQVVQAEQPRVVVKGSTKKQYLKQKAKKKKK